MDSFVKNGFVLLKSIVSDDEIDRLNESISKCNSSPTAPGVRHLLRRSLVVRRLSKSPAILGIAARYLGAGAKPVKAIFFDKTAASN